MAQHNILVPHLNILCPVCSSNYLHYDIKKHVVSSFPHYGHSGIVEAARELFMQIEGNPERPGKK